MDVAWGILIGAAGGGAVSALVIGVSNLIDGWRVFWPVYRRVRRQQKSDCPLR